MLNAVEVKARLEAQFPGEVMSVIWAHYGPASVTMVRKGQTFTMGYLQPNKFDLPRTIHCWEFIRESILRQ